MATLPFTQQAIMPAAPIYQYKPYDYRYDYDFIFSGAGAAGMSLLMRMLHSGKFSDKTFLLVDRDRKEHNDRTWCFWEKDTGFFDPVVFRKWNKVWFHSPDFSKQFRIDPYQYKMIRGLDFYNYCLDYIKQQKNVRILFEPVGKISSQPKHSSLVLENGETYYATQYLFNSILFNPPPADDTTQTLLQHFRGWVIQADRPTFEPEANTLMDFRVNQQQGASFVYTMPFDDRTALVEYTLFSSSHLDQDEYEKGLRIYIQDYLKLENYTILEKESGLIPMTNYRFPVSEGKIINIGTAGGQTKSSSGYTFQFIQRHCKAIIHSLLNHGHPFIEEQYAGRFRFYDNVLLDVLNRKELSGDKIFTRLFSNNSAQRIFRFLDNDTWLLEELLLIGSLPTMPFLRAAARMI
jgi:lycopene beta-cyclase